MKKIFALSLVLVIFCNIVFAQKIDKKADKWVEQTLKSMTLREKIGQEK